MKTSIKIIIVGYVIALFGFVGALLLSPPAGFTGGWHNYSLTVGLAAASAVTHVTAAILLVISLGVYRPKMRQAYVLFALGIVSLAISTLQMPIISYFNLWSSAYVTWGIVNIAMLVYGLFCYCGANILARLIDIKNIFTNFLFLPASLLVALLSILLVRAKFPHAQVGFYVLIITAIWCGLFNAATAMLTHKVYKHIGAHYTQTAAWLAWATILSFLITCIITINTLYVGVDHQSLVNNFVYILGVLSGILWICAGYSFIEAKEL